MTGTLVLRSILAMDSYNRGYNQKIDFRKKNGDEYIENSDTIYTVDNVEYSTKIGTAIIIAKVTYKKQVTPKT